MCCMYTVYSGMQEWVIQIPSIPILVSVLFPSLHLKYFRIKFLLLYIIGASAAKPHMDDTSEIFHILLGRAQRSPTWTIHLGFSIYYRRTSDRSNFAWRRTARGLTAHAHRCVKLKQGQSILNKVRKAMQAKSKR